MSSTPIAEHALLSDRHSSALIDSAGFVEWLGFPRYVDRTLALRTTFPAAGGTVALTDAFAMGPDNGGHRLGKDVPHLLVRRLKSRCGMSRGRSTA